MLGRYRLLVRACPAPARNFTVRHACVHSFAVSGHFHYREKLT